MRVAFFFLSFSFIIGAIGFAYFDLQRNGKSPAAFETAPVVEGVATETPAKTLLPVLNENRSLALSFRPVKKPYALDLSISSAHAAVILDADSGTILYDHNADTKRQVASLTKMLTSLIVIERIRNLDEPVTIGDEIFVDGTRIGCPRSGFCNGERLKIGEQVSVRHLLEAMLMNSANDAATALGKHVGGTANAFAKIMNERARELGLSDSHFCTPSGLETDGHETDCYSTAHDMAIIASQALKHPILWEIMRGEKMTFTSIDGKYEHEIFNTDELLGQFPNLLGTKTGFTPLAGHSLLAAATNDDGKHPVIAVVLDDTTRFESIRSMFHWSFGAFDWK
jgi:D-alanyl-D-alanine carboxypeptidase